VIQLKQQDLHPSVVAFREFINEHPSLLKEVRKKGRPWQEYYEKWVLLGEDDPFWEPFKKEENQTEKTSKESKSNEWFQQLLKYADKMDMNKVQENIHQMSSAITSIQELLNQFQQSNDSTGQNDPFTYKD